VSDLRLVVDIPFAPPRTDKNSRRHWSKRHKADGDAKEAAYWCTLAADNGPIVINDAEWWSASIDWTVYLPKGAHACDTDNMIARLKAYQDGIFRALELDDRMVQAISVTQERDPEGRGRTVAVVTARRRETE
jgi:hypothetical protein